MTPSPRAQMFSSRFRWNLQSNPLNDLLETKRLSGVTILDLTESNPTAVGLHYPVAEILPALAQPAALRYEPHPRGLLVARQAVVDYYHQRGDVVDVKQVHLTTGTSEAYAFLFKLLTDHGDNLLVPQPSYPLFEFLAGLEGAELRPYQLDYQTDEGWAIDLDSVSAAINEQTRAIILVHPNNPTGSYVKRTELKSLASLCKKHNLALIFDEVFFDYRLRGDTAFGGVAVADVLTFVVSGISKILGLPQMKLGWMVVNGPQGVRRSAQELLDLVADTYLSVSTPIQHAAPHWVRLQPRLRQQIHERVAGNLKWLQTQLRDRPAVRSLNVEGGWYAIIELPKIDSEEQLVLRLLEEENVLIHPGFFFDFPREGFLVMSLLPAADDFQEGLRRLLKLSLHPSKD
ncbi:MAG TPA: pyridoxal phosphate-dependent aminotransferase [bacterium]